MPTTLFTNIANAIRSRFGISGTITPLQFGNKINSGTPVLSISTYDSFDVAMAKILENTGDAIREKGGTSAKIAPNDMPDAIRAIKILQYSSSLSTASQNNVTWTSKPSMPSYNLNTATYTLTASYYWSHSSYDSYKVNSVTITPNDTTIYNPGNNVTYKPTGGSTYDYIRVRCSRSYTVDFSELLPNQYLTDDEKLSIMRDELQSAINNFDNHTFSFSISYYPGTYV